MSSDTGTRQLADGLPGYRLVRREDVELRPALPGHSSGLTACRLVDGSLGSTHMALTLVSLDDGHVDDLDGVGLAGSGDDGGAEGGAHWFLLDVERVVDIRGTDPRRLVLPTGEQAPESA